MISACIYLCTSISELSIPGVKRPKNLSVGKAPPYNVMNGKVKLGKNSNSATGGDAPKEASGKIELIDQQPTGQSKLKQNMLLCYVMLCLVLYVVLCYFMLCYAMFC